MRIIDDNLDNDPEILNVALKQSDVNALYYVLINVGGSTHKFPRKNLNQMADVLAIYFKPNKVVGPQDKFAISGSIYFQHPDESL